MVTVDRAQAAPSPNGQAFLGKSLLIVHHKAADSPADERLV